MYIQVAKVESVDEIDSAKLYKCTVDIGQGVIKHVMAGLKRHIAHDDLLGSLVVVITNLKPAKLAGQLSEVMILAAQAQDEGRQQGEVVKVLQTPGAISHQHHDLMIFAQLLKFVQLHRRGSPELQSSVNQQLCMQPYDKHPGIAICIYTPWPLLQHF